MGANPHSPKVWAFVFRLLLAQLGPTTSLMPTPEKVAARMDLLKRFHEESGMFEESYNIAGECAVSQAFPPTVGGDKKWNHHPL